MIHMLTLRWQWLLQHIECARNWNAWNAEKQFGIPDHAYWSGPCITWWPNTRVGP